ncbi:MAG: hypothetical protein OHK0038_00810 [Flammeovirgaceae bacterium]
MITNRHPKDLSGEVSANIIVMRKEKALKSSNKFLLYGMIILVLGILLFIAQLIFGFGFILFPFAIISISLFVLLFGIILRINTNTKK